MLICRSGGVLWFLRFKAHETARQEPAEQCEQRLDDLRTKSVLAPLETAAPRRVKNRCGSGGSAICLVLVFLGGG